jgi:hypothetical protein
VIELRQSSRKVPTATTHPVTVHSMQKWCTVIKPARQRQPRRRTMPGTTIQIRSREGGEFDCYLAMPAAEGQVPAVVLASAVHGVDADIRALADEFAAHGYIAAAPDLFWRSLPGPLAHEDGRAAERSQPRLEKIRAGEADMADTLAHVRSLPQFNGRAATMGSATTPASPVTARGSWTSSRSSTASRRRSASSGAIRTTPPPPRCSMPIAPCRRAGRTSRCTSSPACCTAT